jgi:cytochrome c
MDSFEVNKILGALLGTMTFTLALSIGSEMIFETEKPATAGYALPEPEASTAGKPAAPAVQVAPIAVRLANADLAKGETLIGQCKSCHNFEKGGGKKVGPDLYGIVGREIAAEEGFAYSAALKKLQAEKGKWTFQELDDWLENPKAYAPGTAMSFAGIRRPEQRGDLIAYLNKNSDNPEPLPAPPPASAAGAGTQPAGTEAAAGGAAQPAAPGAAPAQPAAGGAAPAAPAAQPNPGPLQQPATPGSSEPLPQRGPQTGGPAGHEQNSPAQVEQRQGLQAPGADRQGTSGSAAGGVSPPANMSGTAPAPAGTTPSAPSSGTGGTVPTVPPASPAAPVQPPATTEHPAPR